MSDPDLFERVLEKLLAGTSPRVVEALFGHDDEARKVIDAARETVTSLGLGLAQEAPSSDLRARIDGIADARPFVARRSALLVIDMQVDHLTPDLPLYVSRARDIVPAMRARLDKAHEEGEPVIYVVDHHEPGDPELEVMGVHNVGEPREDIWPELAAAEGDVIVTHRGYSGFFETRLDAVLRSLDVNTVVVTGCLTELHLFTTATDALQRGYGVEVPVATQAGNSETSEAVVLATLKALSPMQPFARPHPPTPSP